MGSDEMLEWHGIIWDTTNKQEIKWMQKMINDYKNSKTKKTKGKKVIN